MYAANRDDVSDDPLHWLQENTNWTPDSSDDGVQVNGEGLTAIHAACGSKAPLEVVESLVRELGERTVYEVDDNGHTALHFAVYRRKEDGTLPDLEVISYLLGYFGRRCFDICRVDKMNFSEYFMAKKHLAAAKINEDMKEEILNILQVSEWVPGSDKNFSSDFTTFKILCRIQRIESEMIQLFLEVYGFPVEKLFHPDEAFEVVDFLYVTMMTSKLYHTPQFAYIQKFREEQIQHELTTVLEEKDEDKVPINRSRISFVGQGRAGKTSTIRNIRQEPFDSSLESTSGISIADASVRNIGVEISSSSVESASSGSGVWTKTRKKCHVGARTDLRTTRSFKVKKRNKFEGRMSLNEGVFERDHGYSIDQEDGKCLHVLVYDYGGQTIFHNICVQEVCTPRNACYAVVFNIMDIISGEKRRAALKHIEYWLKSIKNHAICEMSDDSNLGLSFRQAPVVLVGTHFDVIKEPSQEVEDNLKFVHNILVDNFGSLQIFQTSKTDETLKGRNDLYNHDQDLCFWPVDNTDSKDLNVQRLGRQILINATVNDPLDYIKQLVPTSWKKSIDAFMKLATQKPLIKISSSDENVPSMTSILQECNAFDDLDEADSVYCKRRALAFIQFCHSHVSTLFSCNSFPGLQDYCILDRQWVLDEICYIVRDFKIHRFHRDFNAMKLKNGKPWRDLLTKGILDFELLRMLWHGNEENMSFLLNFLVHLGMFGMLPVKENDSLLRLFVPAMITEETEGWDFSESRILDYLGRTSTEEVYSSSFESEESFKSSAYYNRVVTRLVTVWKSSYMLEDPVVLPRGCLLKIGSIRYALVLCLRSDSFVINFTTATKDQNDEILPHIMKALIDINNQMYSGHLHFRKNGERIKVDLEETEKQISEEDLEQYRNLSLISPLIESQPLVTEGQKDAYELFFSFLTKYELPEVKAKRIARLIAAIDTDFLPENLKQIFDEESDEHTFRKEILYDWMGVKNAADQRLIINALRSCPSPLPKEDYFIGYFHEENLTHVRKEKRLICRRLAQANLSTTTINMGAVDMLRKNAKRNNKILHLAMHGNIHIGDSDIPTLAFRRENGLIVDPDELTAALALCCKTGSGARHCTGGSVECVFFNACSTYGLATSLKKKHGVQWILSWETEVNDEAAMCFAEAFYHFLGTSREHSRRYQDAFNRAYAELKLRGWVMIDPRDRRLLLRTQHDECNVKLKAAGIPHFYTNTFADPERWSTKVNFSVKGSGNKIGVIDSKCSCSIS